MTNKIKKPVATGPKPVLPQSTQNNIIDNTTPSRSIGGAIDILRYAWLLIPALLLFSTLNKYADNVPVKDDFDAILVFLIKYKSGDTAEKLRLFFTPHSEHRIVTSRLLYAIWYELTGTINFKALIYIGNLMLIPVFMVCAHFIKKFSSAYWYIPAAIMSMLIFDLANYENNYFPMAGVANFGVVMYFMLSLYCYDKDTKLHLWAGALFQILCIYSNGNGMIGAFVIAAATLFSGNRKRMIVAFSVFTVFTALYFINYNRLGSSGGSPVLMNIIPFYLRMIGSHFLYEQSMYAGIIILILLAVCFPVSKKMEINKNAIPLIAILVFVLLSLAVVAVFRSGEELHSHASRYFIYSKIATGLLLCFAFQKLLRMNKKVFWPVTVVSLLMFTGLFIYGRIWGEGGVRLEKRKRLRYEFYYKPDGNEIARKICDEACSLNIYCIEENREDATPEDYFP